MIVETFAGPGGWAVGLRLLGYDEDVAIDHDPDACATRRAAGFSGVRADVAALDPLDYPPNGGGFIASPPCQSFSSAGKRLGLEDVRGQLVYEVIRWLHAWHKADVAPSWVACEQVKEVLPLWKLFAPIMQEMGYKTWYGILNAADYGVPQTRKRAILMASKRPFSAPAATHAENPSTDLFGDARQRWVTMAQALGWEPSDVINTRGNRKTSGGNEFSTDQPSWALTEKTRSWLRYKPMLHTNRDQREDGSRQVIDPEAQPAPTFTAKSGGQWQVVRNLRVGSDKGVYVPTRRSMDEPAPTLAFGNDMKQVVWELEEVPDDQLWATERPSTTIVGSFRPDIVAAPGWRNAGDGPRQNTPGSVQIEPHEAGLLQSFPIDYPWKGSRTKVFQQIGNACPPRLAAAILKPLIEANA